ncbi:MAG: hypothetical protein AAB227_06865 [Pseudomonadota bacterium]
MVEAGAAGGKISGSTVDRILSLSRHLAPVDEVFSFLSVRNRAPKILGSASILGSAQERTFRYAKEYYRDDPIEGMRSSGGAAAISSYVLSADDIKRSDYREFCFDRPKLRQKICFEQAAGAGRIMCNFYLRQPVGADLFERLEELAAIAMPSLSQVAETHEGDEESLAVRIEARLGSAYGELTMRERQVCARTIAGWSAAAIAIDLGIGVGSVLTYRRRAYDRYDYSSAGEFLHRIVH